METKLSVCRFASFSSTGVGLGQMRNIPIEAFPGSSSNSQMSRHMALLSESYVMDGLSLPCVIFVGGDDGIDDQSFHEYIERFHRRNRNELKAEDSRDRAAMRKGFIK